MFISLPPCDDWLLADGHITGVFFYYGGSIADTPLELRIIPIGSNPDADYQAFPIDLSQTTVHDAVEAPVLRRMGQEKGWAYLSEEKTQMMRKEIESFVSQMVFDSPVCHHAMGRTEGDR